MSGILGRELVWANAEAGMHKCVLEAARGPLSSPAKYSLPSEAQVTPWAFFPA